MKKPWKCHAASNWADGLCFKYSNCMKVNCLLVLPVCLSLFLSLFCVYLLSLFLCLALVFVSVSQWILSVKNCGAIVVLEIQHQGQHPNLPVSSLVSQWSHFSIRFIWQESVLQWSQLSIRFIWQESVPTHFQIIHASFYGSLRRWRSCLAQ